MLKMADRNEIIDALESLAVHCRPPLMSVEDRSRWMADWCEDLKNCDATAIKTACQRWRMGSDRKFPMAGQLLPLVRAVTVSTPSSSDTEEQWRPLSDAEYESLSLREKVRHHRIMASECRIKAGPMWRNGTHAEPEQLPEKWHEFQAKARGHDEEARRLNNFMRRPPTTFADRSAAQ
jgi:hypothetical protein